MSIWTIRNGVWETQPGEKVETAPVQIPKWTPPLIPIVIAEEAYKEYSAQYGTRQTLERLNERGGFSWNELAVLLYERCKRLEEKA